MVRFHKSSMVTVVVHLHCMLYKTTSKYIDSIQFCISLIYQYILFIISPIYKMTVHIEILEVLNGAGYIIYQNCSPAFKTKVMKLNTTIMFIFFGYLLFRTVLLALEVKTLKDKCAKLEHNISQNYNDYKELDSIFMNQVIPMSYRIGWTDGRNSNSTFKADSIKFEKDIHKWH